MSGCGNFCVRGECCGGVLNPEGKCVFNPEFSEMFVKEILEALHENCDL